MQLLQTRRKGSLGLSRLCLRGAAFILVSFGIWAALPEFLKLVPLQKARDLAATLGLVRGDLWAAAALSSAAQNPEANQFIHNDSDQSSVAMFALRAVALSPWRGDMWLLLARQASVDPSTKNRTVALLEMSYFVAPDAIGLAGERLRLAAHILGEDAELRSYVMADVGLILRERPDDTAAIVRAYQEADEVGHRAIRDAVGQTNSRLQLP